MHKKRLDCVLIQLSNMDNEPDEEAPGSGAAELSITKSTFIESDYLPVHYLTLLEVS